MLKITKTVVFGLGECSQIVQNVRNKIIIVCSNIRIKTRSYSHAHTNTDTVLIDAITVVLLVYACAYYAF